MFLNELSEVGEASDRVVVRFDGVDYLINEVYVDRGQLVLETGRFNEDDGSEIVEDDIV